MDTVLVKWHIWANDIWKETGHYPIEWMLDIAVYLLPKHEYASLRGNDTIWKWDGVIEYDDGEWGIPMKSEYFVQKPSDAELTLDPGRWHSERVFTKNKYQRKHGGFTTSRRNEALSDWDRKQTALEAKSAMDRLLLKLGPTKERHRRTLQDALDIIVTELIDNVPDSPRLMKMA